MGKKTYGIYEMAFYVGACVHGLDLFGMQTSVLHRCHDNIRSYPNDLFLTVTI